MSNYLCYNGQQVKSDSPVLYATNRAFCYGDGVFETIRCLNSKPLFFDKHYLRLRNALYHLKIDLPAEYTENYFELIIHNLLQRNRIYKGARARLTVFRSQGGFYSPTSYSAEFILTVDSLSDEVFELNHSGLHVDIYKDIHKPVNMLSQFKTSSSLMFVMAGLWKKEHQFDDCFILNQSGLIVESLASNIFLVKNNKLITPSVESGCVDGTMRRTILEIAATEQIPVIESDGLTENHLLTADEIFITNAIAGINWIGAYKDKRYFHSVASNLLNLLNKKVEYELTQV